MASVELLEELEALEAIFAGDVIIEPDVSRECYDVIFKDIERHLSLIFTLPNVYPSDGYARCEVSFNHDQAVCLLRQRNIAAKVVEFLDDHRGDAVVFDAIEAIKSFVDNELSSAVINSTGDLCSSESFSPPKAVDEEVALCSDFRSGAETDESSCSHATFTSLQEAHVEVMHGKPVTHMKSVFQAHLAHVSSMKEVKAFREEVLGDKKCANATHNMFAFRFTDSSSGIVYHDCDDDGECAAGTRMAEMMRLMGVTGVAVIVTRWYGGVKLGPDRFKLISNCARQLLEEHGYGARQSSTPNSSATSSEAAISRRSGHRAKNK